MPTPHHTTIADIVWFQLTTTQEFLRKLSRGLLKTERFIIMHCPFAGQLLPVGPFQSEEDWYMLFFVLERPIADLEHVPRLLVSKNISSPKQLLDMGISGVAELLGCTIETATRVYKRCTFYSREF
jgi:hypothetical protein